MVVDKLIVEDDPELMRWISDGRRSVRQTYNPVNVTRRYVWVVGVLGALSLVALTLQLFRTTGARAGLPVIPFQPPPPLVELVPVPAGTFEMGAVNTDACANRDEETPQHTVLITRPFAIGRTEITRGEYIEIMGDRPDPDLPGGHDHPVAFITWFDALEFCNRLSQREGLRLCYRRTAEGIVCDFTADGYRLPTEAEWEYACRAGTVGLFSSGTHIGGCGPDNTSSDLESVAWYGANSGGAAHPVGQKAPNPWGLFDMHGNIWEWCWDSYNYYEEAYDAPISDPANSGSGSFRVLRGGSWFGIAADCRSAARFANVPDQTDEDFGFRIARTLPQAETGPAPAALEFDTIPQ